jgi:hypothetical protein
MPSPFTSATRGAGPRSATAERGGSRNGACAGADRHCKRVFVANAGLQRRPDRAYNVLRDAGMTRNSTGRWVRLSRTVKGLAAPSGAKPKIAYFVQNG